MKLHSVTMNQFPRCTRFIQVELCLERLRQRKKVWDAFLNACTVIDWDGTTVTRFTPPAGIGIDRFAKQAVTWQDGPMVSVMPGLVKVPLGGDACGSFDTNMSGDTLLTISDIVMRFYEKRWADPLSSEMLETTLLHECVHWAWFRAGIDGVVPTFPGYSPMEIGNAFEVWAYGTQRCTKPNVEIAQSRAR